MTSFAFIAGLLPLVVATGAGAIGNRTIGTTAVGGMLVGTVFGVLIIPGLYYIFGHVARLENFLRNRRSCRTVAAGGTDAALRGVAGLGAHRAVETPGPCRRGIRRTMANRRERPLIRARVKRQRSRTGSAQRRGFHD